jgi:predicted nucleic acid-binding protein
VRWFFDTSVLIATFLEDHEHHEASLAAFVAAGKKQAGCAAHTLAELYSALTRLPGRHRLSGDQVLLFLEAIEERLTIVSLDSHDYFSTLRVSGAQGILGGMVYDALIARCAIKVSAEAIYTWNLDHFRRLGADVAKRVRTP